MGINNFNQHLLRIEDSIITAGAKAIENAGDGDVKSALSKIPVDPVGFTALLSPSADRYDSQIEQKARELTAQRFGRVVNLYIPLYLTSSCINSCLYCGFAKENRINRKTLDMTQIETEGKRIRSEGYRSILLVAGEDPREAPVEYLESAIKIMKRLGFIFVAIEVAPMSEEDYRRLGSVGLDSVTVYQETYDRELYKKLHPKGPKSNFDYRLETAERIARAGIRSIGIGFLLGLSDWRKEILCLSAHLKYMNRYHWQTFVSVSFPRIHTSPDGFKPDHPVSDKELVRIISAMRLRFPDAVLTLSTREVPELRDRLFGRGINQISAGSKTSPGGYSVDENSDKQFEVSDERSPKEVIEAIRELGFESVFKDWDTNLKPVS